MKKGNLLRNISMLLCAAFIVASPVRVNAEELRNCRKITDATCLGESPEIQRKRL